MIVNENFMPLKFNTKKAVNVILFILKSLGGKCDPFRLFAILYAADLKHLASFDSLILDDSYIAMKQGAVPFNVYSMYLQLCHNADTDAEAVALNLKEYFYINEQNLVVSIAPYDDRYISQSEATCLFEAIRENKNESFETLSKTTRNLPWREANKNGEISLLSMAKESGASPELLNYISHSLNEGTAFAGDSAAE
ncbi:MAG: hypothetical protein BGO69_15190 [Bacteroidetes bacterium 46-16]|nr:MAG: hypothetical protein BGO69_15190 [Bacteroidetes bacterium 46-16]